MRPPEVRVLAGRWKGRRLPAGPNARPTSSRARKALYDILGEHIVGARVLDLYAGSGALGIEAVSRGAKSAVLVEPDAEPLCRTAERIGAGPDEVRVLAGGAASAVADLAARAERFDFVFADPPYADSLDGAMLAMIPGLLADGGRLVLQRDSDAPGAEIPGLALAARRAYGRNVFLFYGMR